MKRYKKYKPSGIEWIGEIPEHWTLATVGRVSNLGRGRVISSIEIGENPGEFPVYSSQTENNGVMGYLNSFNFKGEYVTWTTDGANAGTVFFRKGKFNCTNVCGTIQPKNWEQIDLRFIPYFLNLGTKYSVRLDINPKLMNNMMAKIPIVIPPKEEQTTIANYLNYKTAQIDDLIAKKQKLIDLLNEEKTAIINQAVTKGLDPNTPMKDSGIPWLGEIPAHWEIRKLKYVSKINPEALTENTKEDFRFFYIDISSVDSEGNITDLIELLFKDAPSRARRIVKQEDTIISTVRTYLKAIAFIQREDSNLICSTGFSVIRPDPKVFRPKFLFCLLRSDKIINAISSLSKGVSYPAIDSEDLAEMATWFPPREEQDAILNYIEANKYRIDKTISKINKEIELLQEYRTALISEAVTGKIKVS
jgi:type I restriction enzyme S subunit